MTLEEAIKIIELKEINDLPQYRQLVFDYELLDAALILLQEYRKLTSPQEIVLQHTQIMYSDPYSL